METFHLQLVFHKLCLIVTHWFLVRFSSNFQENSWCHLLTRIFFSCGYFLFKAGIQIFVYVFPIDLNLFKTKLFYLWNPKTNSGLAADIRNLSWKFGGNRVGNHSFKIKQSLENKFLNALYWTWAIDKSCTQFLMFNRIVLSAWPAWKLTGCAIPVGNECKTFFQSFVGLSKRKSHRYKCLLYHHKFTNGLFFSPQFTVHWFFWNFPLRAVQRQSPRVGQFSKTWSCTHGGKTARAIFACSCCHFLLFF